jgi:hypothetical protein
MRLKSPALSLDIEPTLEDIGKALSDVQAVKDGPFLILERSETTYLQTVYSPGGYRLECQFESTDRHFTAKRTLTHGEIARAFELYFKGDTAWKQGIGFEPTNMPRPLVFKAGYFMGNLAVKIGRMFGRK